MKKNTVFSIVMMALLLTFGLAFSSCVEFMDGFVEGYEQGRNLSDDSPAHYPTPYKHSANQLDSK